MKKNKKQIQILDVTLREGNYIIDFGLTPSQVAQICEYLEAAGVSYIELPHDAGIQKICKTPATRTNEYVRAGRSGVKKTKIGIFLSACSSIPELEEAAPHIDFVRIAAHANELKSVLPLIRKTKELKLLNFFQLVRSPAFTPLQLATAARKVEKVGTDVIYLVDSMGSLTPELVKNYIKTLKKAVKIPLGFHGHNNLGLAIANSLTAIEAGCEWVDASVLGVGRQAGNTQFEVLAALLEKQDLQTKLDLPLLFEIAESLIKPIFKSYKGIEPIDAWAAYHNLDIYPPFVFQALAVSVGLDVKTFIKELKKMKGFLTLDENQLEKIGRRFSIPKHEIIQSIQVLTNSVRM